MKRFFILLCTALCAPLLSFAESEKAAVPWSVLTNRQIQTLMKGESLQAGEVDTLLCTLPESEQAEVKILATSDPAAAKAFIGKRMTAKKEADAARSAAIQKTAAAVRTCEDPAQKEKLTSDLRKLVKEEFDATTRNVELQLKRQEMRLQEVRNSYEKRIANADRMIDQKTKRLVNGRNKGRKGRKAKDAAPKAEKDKSAPAPEAPAK